MGVNSMHPEIYVPYALSHTRYHFIHPQELRPLIARSLIKLPPPYRRCETYDYETRMTERIFRLLEDAYADGCARSDLLKRCVGGPQIFWRHFWI